jgi:hypothetical protein
MDDAEMLEEANAEYSQRRKRDDETEARAHRVA